MSLRSRPSVSSGSVAASSEETTMLSTPAGSPASARIPPSASAESGVSDEGRRITVQPAASAAAMPRAGTASGKFQGVMIRHGPTGRRAPAPGAAVGGVRAGARDPHGLLGEPLEVVRGEGDLVARLREGLAHLEREDQRQPLGLGAAARRPPGGGSGRDPGPATRPRRPAPRPRRRGRRGRRPRRRRRPRRAARPWRGPRP